MRISLIRFFPWLAAGLLILTACNLPSTAAPTAIPSPEPPSATASPRPPTATLTLEPTATASSTLPPPETPTPAIPLAEVKQETACRLGPAGNYDLVATYPVGQKLEIVANDLGAGFLYVRNPQKPEEGCWLRAASLTIYGDISSLPQFTPPPSPLPAPAFSATYQKIYQCKTAVSFVFIIQNTGGSAFRSAYIKATDVKTGKSTEQAVNAFDLWAECVVAKNIAPLTPGSTGYLYSVPFKTDLSGRALKVVIMACTEQYLKGECVTQSLDIKPK